MVIGRPMLRHLAEIDIGFSRRPVRQRPGIALPADGPREAVGNQRLKLETVSRARAHDPARGPEWPDDELLLLFDSVVARLSLELRITVEVAEGAVHRSPDGLQIVVAGEAGSIRIAAASEIVVADLHPRSEARRQRVATRLCADVCDDRRAAPRVREFRWR